MLLCGWILAVRKLLLDALPSAAKKVSFHDDRLSAARLIVMTCNR
jgi:hypothetical protein